MYLYQFLKHILLSSDAVAGFIIRSNALLPTDSYNANSNQAFKAVMKYPSILFTRVKIG